jgi:hypothetical protein
MPLLRKNHPWNAGYALPDHVFDEPQRRGTLTTAQLRNGTIDLWRSVV